MKHQSMLHRNLTALGVYLLLLVMLYSMAAVQNWMELFPASSLPKPRGQVSVQHVSTKIPEATQQQVMKTYYKLPLSFEVNEGQIDGEVKFLSRGSGYTLFLTSTEMILALQNSAQVSKQSDRASRISRSDIHNSQSAVLRMKLLGANTSPRIFGQDELSGKSNYFIGKDPQKWHANVSNYAKVEYKDVYPGVDLVYYGNHRQLEYDFVIAPGADPKTIALGFEGADKLEVDVEGDLVLHSLGGQTRVHKPLVYQEVDGARQKIAGGYVLKDKHQIGFQVDTFDATRPLIIDPVLVYSTYLGGNASEQGNGIAVDAAGNAYVTGQTPSTNFPLTNPLQPAFGGMADVFVSKLNAAGSALVYSTYLGGGGPESGIGVTVEAAGNVYVVGFTESTDFPTVNPLQPSSGGSSDAFIAKILQQPPNQLPVADAGPDQNIECVSSSGTVVTLNGSGSTDPDDDQLTYTWSENSNIIAGPTTSSTAQVTLGPGSHTIELTVDDGNGGADMDEVIIEVRDTTPPSINVTLSPNQLWLPNHKLKNIHATVTVDDACDPAPSVVLFSIVSDEPDDGLGDGDKANDIQGATYGTADYDFQVRAERASNGDGRVYTVTYKVTDASSNSASAQATVTVPHDMGKAVTETEFEEGIPEDYALFQNYPNPFNPETEIRFQLPKAGHVVVKIFNIVGEEIRTLVEAPYQAGYHSVRWNGKDKHGKPVASGIYLYQLQAGGFSQVRKLSLLR